MGAGLAIDFLALNRSNDALRRGDVAGYGYAAIRRNPMPLPHIVSHNPATVYPPAGGYCMGLELTQHRRLLFISGQVPERSDGSVPEGFEAQCEQAWRNVKEVLAAAGLGVEHLVKVTTFLTDRAQLVTNRTIRRAMLGDHQPAVTVVIAQTVNSKWLLEIEAIAAE
ncbi:RidA family protein [Bradyrhizobium sp. SEMIA]|uniref:RidA family protein n=2 Tax=Nitrobacteraceae TaxID=41294 RepID=A0AAE7NX84_9BRAD|nr:RidA family protein [Bradyrhizobium sp. SEMIA]QOZ73738.1 RidA family protein [Bradyrhizobium arachidis]